MATLTVSKGDFIRPHRRVRLRHFPEGASQTFIIGDPIILVTTSDKGNQIKIAAADPTTDRSFIGFAAEAASGVEGTSIGVWLATGDAEFVARCEAAAAIDNDDIGVEYGIVADATNLIWRLDRTETSAKIFRVLELLDTHGDVNGRLVVMVIAPERLYHD